MRPCELKRSKLCTVLTEDSDRTETLETLATLALLLDAKDSEKSKKHTDHLVEKLKASINEKKLRLEQRTGLLRLGETIAETRTVGLLEGRLLVSEHKSRLCEILRDTNRLECKNYADQSSQTRLLKNAEGKSNGRLKGCRSNHNPKETKTFKDSVTQTRKLLSEMSETKSPLKENENLTKGIEKLSLSGGLQIAAATTLEKEKI